MVNFFILLLAFPLFAGVQDPYAYFEEMKAPRTIEWVEAQNAQTLSYLKEIPEREAIHKRLQLFSDYENYGLPVLKGERLFFFMRAKGEELHHLAMVESDGEMSVLLPSHPKAPLSSFEVSGDGKFVAYGVSESGADKQVWKFLNVETGEILADEIEGIQFSTPIWCAKNAGVYYISFEENVIYYHKLGEEHDLPIFEVKGEERQLLLELSRPFDNVLLFEVITGWSRDNAVYLLDVEKREIEELVPMGKGQYHYMGEVEGQLLFLTDEGVSRNRLVAYQSGWYEIVPENDKTLMEAVPMGNKIICNYLEDCTSVLECFDASGHPCGRFPLPGKGSVTLAGEAPFFAYTDVMTPQAIYHIEKGLYFKPNSEPLSGYVTEQRFFKSKDGTEVSLFVTHKKGLKLTGDHPTFLYGYGGFNIPITPVYSPLIATWLDRGGVFVSVNLRGGGEYGKEWHEAGTKGNKQNVFDDFIAAAEFLIESGYTRPDKLAINGRSNGGLLVGACLVQRPDLFGAAVPQVGVLDMLKFNHFTIGWSWTSDYGNPDDPEDFPYLYAYSPYHNIQEGVHYPPTLITTADHDDRVVPLHSYKFAAALQEAQGGPDPILLRVYPDTGHGRGRSLEQAIEENTDILSFLSFVLITPLP